VIECIAVTASYTGPAAWRAATGPARHIRRHPVSDHAIARTVPGMAIARFPSIVIDCPDPGALASFYGAMLDWKVDVSSGWAEVGAAAGDIGRGVADPPAIAATLRVASWHSG